MRNRPNVLVVLVDDMGYGDFSCYNRGLSYTPRIDALLQEGIRLTQHYSACPVCAPARAAMMSGRYPQRTGSIDTLECRGADRLALKEVTMADVFKRAGYRTGLFGKWHLGALDARFHPLRRGFDHFTGFCGGWSDYRSWRLDRDGKRMDADGRYLTDVLTDEAIRFIRQYRREPFFLHLTYNAPHTPLQAPESEVRRFMEAGHVSYPVAVLYGMIARLDASLGRVLDVLDSEGLAKDTMVLFTSDNGPQFESEIGSLERFNCDFSGRKGRVYEGGIRVPAALRWPAGLPAGVDHAHLVHFTDWLPTLAGLCGVDTNSCLPLDGKNLAASLQGEQWRDDPVRFWQWNRYTPNVHFNAAMRDHEWKLVRPPVKAGFFVSESDRRLDHMLRYDMDSVTDIVRDAPPSLDFPDPPPPVELYNLSEDPLERHNQAQEHPDRVLRMSRALENWFEEVESERLQITD